MTSVHDDPLRIACHDAEFLDSDEARPLRILAQYLDLGDFQRERIHDGTLDELTEILMLSQARKLDCRIAMLLYGSDYWREITPRRRTERDPA